MFLKMLESARLSVPNCNREDSGEGGEMEKRSMGEGGKGVWGRGAWGFRKQSMWKGCMGKGVGKMVKRSMGKGGMGEAEGRCICKISMHTKQV